MAYELPPLPYAYDALEPYYDQATLTLHHDKHHAGYVRGLNAAEAKLAAARESGDTSGVKALSQLLAFHGSGHILHSVFWTNMKAGGGGAPAGDLAAQINTDFGSFDAFLAQFKAATTSVEGSGWGLLVWSRLTGKLEILQALNHQHSSQWGAVPIMAVDVWEHAYYLKFQNRRAEWVNTFFANLVNWDDVASRFANAK